MPHFVGLYHAYVRGSHRDTRSHRLFIVTSGGCNRLCDTFFNLTVDVRHDMTIKDVLDSEEAWYLRRVNSRNNNKILQRIAKELGIKVNEVADPFTLDQTKADTVLPTTETTLFDAVQITADRASYFSNCVSTLSCRNGILCAMHPNEGVWLFKGAPCTKAALQYGGPFGRNETMTTFPVNTSPVGSNTWNTKAVPGSPVAQGKACFVKSTDTIAIARLDGDANLIEGGPVTENYTYINDAYTQMLKQECMWDGNWGHVELMPIAVVVVDHHK